MPELWIWKPSGVVTVPLSSTDTVSVFKFPTTGLAQKYEASTSNVYVIEDLVLVFAPTVSSELKQDYEKVVARLAA